MFARIFAVKPLWSSSIQFRYLSCWSCGVNTERNLLQNLFCSNCKMLQKPQSDQNYFKIMGINETFDLDQNELARKYKDLQKHLHPDKFANKDTEEQEISAKYSSLVNDAYKTLLEPLSRGMYMMKLLGKEIPENTVNDQEFLMEIMEKNEEIENADNESDILNLNEENKQVLGDLQKKISKAFLDGDLKTVLKLLGRMKYYASIDNQIQASIRNRGIIR